MYLKSICICLCGKIEKHFHSKIIRYIEENTPVWIKSDLIVQSLYSTLLTPIN